MGRSPDAVTFHDALADSWEERYGHGSFARRARFIDEVIFPATPSGGTWLDAGCGTGTFARLMAKRGHNVVGVDGSASMIAEAQRQASASTDRLSFSRIDTIEHLPFGPSAFDGVMCFSVLEYLDNPVSALEELGRVLKRGGTLVCSVPHAGSALRRGQQLWRSLSAAPKDFGYLELSRFATTPDAMRKALTPAGLDLIKARGFDPILPSAVHSLLKPSLLYLTFHKAP